MLGKWKTINDTYGESSRELQQDGGKTKVLSNSAKLSKYFNIKGSIS